MPTSSHSWAPSSNAGAGVSAPRGSPTGGANEVTGCVTPPLAAPLPTGPSWAMGSFGLASLKAKELGPLWI